MPVIDGEKWACSSCIKGHRVSGCNHNDRELHHINPKGRPVKQCEHCRGARKSKSHHAKCDCGDKKDKLKEKSELKRTPISGYSSCRQSEAFLVQNGQNGQSGQSGQNGSCRCHLGSKCICGANKDLEKVDLNRQSLHNARTKPKLVATHSEPHLTVFANGHHKPCHRNNNSAHVSGAPYRLSRPHTLHGHSAFAALAQNGGYGSILDTPTTRSMDTLSVSNNDFYAMFGSTPRSMASMPTTNMTTLDPLALQEGLFADATNTDQAWQWPATTPASVHSTFSYANFPASPSRERIASPENEWVIPSAGINSIWSATDLPLNSGKFDDSLAQPISHSGESKQSGPGLTAASSVHSEVGDANIAFGEMAFTTPPPSGSETLFWDDSPVSLITTTAASDSLTTAAPLSAMTTMSNMQMLPPTFQKGFSPLASSTSSAVQPSYAAANSLAMSGNFEEVIKVDAWPVDPSNGSFGTIGGFDPQFSGDWF